MSWRNFWTNLKKYKRAIIGTSLACVVTIPIIVISVQSSSHPLIFSIGSSAVKPMVEELAKAYNKDQAPDFDLIVDGGGSATGIQAVANLKTNVGNASREPKQEEAGRTIDDSTGKTVDGTYAKQWKENRIKTVTIGWDSIGIVYKAPKGVDFNLDIDDSNIGTLYAAMTGWYTGADLTLWDLMPNNEELKKYPIYAYSRSGGANKSGTADAFAKDSHLNPTYKANYDEKAIKDALIDGQYNLSRKIETTNESNIETWKRVSSDQIDGAITYLSGAFILNNWNEINQSGFKVATYKKKILDQNHFDTDVANGYNWVRPINCIFSLEEKNWNQKQLEAFKSFIQWIVHPNASDGENSSDKVLKKVWLKSITPEQVEQMQIPRKDDSDQTWKSDYELASPNVPAHFGAYLTNMGASHE